MTRDATQADKVLDLDGALEQMDGDIDLLREIVELFMDSVPEHLRGLESAIAADDSAEVELLAHSLKGSAANIGAHRFVAAADDLEIQARSGKLDGASEFLDAIREEFAELNAATVDMDWPTLADGVDA